MDFRPLVLLSFLGALFGHVSVEAATNNNAFKLRNSDIDRILSNDRILSSYIKCLLDEGPCAADGRDLKKLLPDALSTGCARCTSQQKQFSERVIKHLMTKRNRDWTRLVAKYDPSGEYQKRFAPTLAQNKKTAARPTASMHPKIPDGHKVNSTHSTAAGKTRQSQQRS